MLPLLATAPAAHAVERGVRRRPVQPGGGVLGLGRVQAVEVDEDLLRDILGLLGVAQDAVGDAGDAVVLGLEQSLERVLF